MHSHLDIINTVSLDHIDVYLVRLKHSAIGVIQVLRNVDGGGGVNFPEKA